MLNLQRGRLIPLALLGSMSLASSAFAQGAPASGNLFWATPDGTSGYLALRSITAGDLSGASSNIAANTVIGNPTGSGAPAQPITLSSSLLFSGTTLILSTGAAAVAIASLPTCNSTSVGQFATVNNGQTSPPFNGTVSTTGAVYAPVGCVQTGASTYGWVYR